MATDDPGSSDTQPSAVDDTVAAPLDEVTPRPDDASQASSSERRAHASGDEETLEAAADTVAGRPQAPVADGGNLRVGDRIGHFEIESVLGRGGMGVVHAAHDHRLDRRVAIKLVLGSVAGSEGSHERLRLEREAKALARLAHPNVVQVFETGEHAGQLFIVMEFVDGIDLREHFAGLPGGDDRWRAIVEAMLAAGEGLAAAHEADLVHRDFKPDNVLVDRRGRVRVMDFGVARTYDNARLGELELGLDRTDVHAAADIGMTRTGTLLGTPAYMSPEQFQGAKVDARSDQFAFCVVLYEGLFGRRPFEADNVAALLAKVLEGPDPEIPEGVCPPAVAAVLRRGLARPPEDRFESMTALLQALRQAIEPATPSRKTGVLPWVLGLAALGGVAITLIPATPSPPPNPLALTDGPVAPEPTELPSPLEPTTAPGGDEPAALSLVGHVAAWLPSGVHATQATAPGTRSLWLTDGTTTEVEYIDVARGTQRTLEVGDDSLLLFSAGTDEVLAQIGLRFVAIDPQGTVRPLAKRLGGELLQVSYDLRRVLMRTEDAIGLHDLETDTRIVDMPTASRDEWVLSPQGDRLARIERQLPSTRIAVSVFDDHGQLVGQPVELGSERGFPIEGKDWTESGLHFFALEEITGPAELVDCPVGAEGSIDAEGCQHRIATYPELEGVAGLLPLRTAGPDAWWLWTTIDLGSQISVIDARGTKASRTRPGTTPLWLDDDRLGYFDAGRKAFFVRANDDATEPLAPGYEVLAGTREGLLLLRDEPCDEGCRLHLRRGPTESIEAIGGTEELSRAITDARCSANRCVTFSDTRGFRVIELPGAFVGSLVPCPPTARCYWSGWDLSGDGERIAVATHAGNIAEMTVGEWVPRPIEGTDPGQMVAFDPTSSDVFVTETSGRYPQGAVLRVHQGRREVLWESPGANITRLAAASGQLAVEVRDLRGAVIWLGPQASAPPPSPASEPEHPAEPIVDSGYIPRAAMTKVVRARIDDVRRCYTAALERDPTTAGKVEIEFVIGPAGNVVSAGLGASKVGDPVLVSCIAAQVMTWQFPAPEGGSVRVSYPFDLSPG